MEDVEELSMVIPGYVPETMPLDRLIEYLQQMAAVLGDASNLHLIRIERSSVQPILHAPRATALAARDKAMLVQRGGGTRRQKDAYERIRRMIRRDSVGTEYAGRPALLKTGDRVILEIPAAPEEAGAIEGVRQATCIDGQLIRVGGAGDDATLQLQELDGRILSNLNAKRHLAKELGKLLWEPVRLAGDGIWNRDSEGRWSLSRMQVLSYEKLEDEDAVSTISRLRNQHVRWPADAWDRVLKERGGDV